MVIGDHTTKGVEEKTLKVNVHLINLYFLLCTYPIFKRAVNLAVIEDDIEYKHDSNQSVEASKGCPGGELSLIGNIHPDGEH